MDTTQHTATATAPHASARGVDDLLGYIGHVLGRLPRSSVCFITMQGRSLRAVARVDVPVPVPATASARRRWAETVSRCVRSDAGADGCLVVCHEPGVAGRDHRPLAPALRRALGEAGVPAVAAWCVDDGVAVAWTGEGEGIDVGDDGTPRPLSPPELSTVSLALTAEGSVWNGGPGGDGVPTPSAAHAPWPLPPGDDEASIRSWLGLWHRVLTGQACLGVLNRRQAAAPLSLPLWRDRLLGMAAVGLGPADPEDACPVDLYLAEGPQPPRWDLLDVLHDELRSLVPDLPIEQAANALAVVGWIAWARGQGSRAGAHLEEAWRLRPGHGLTSLLLRLVEGGRIAGWAADPRTAWRPAG
ncbi:DUF4192 family protein [Micrococcus luteus]